MTSTDTPALLRVGIIGTGGISRAHAPGWQALDAELHAFSTEGAPAFGEQYGATIHPTLEALLDAVDVVDVCTPTQVHAEIVHQAIDAGVPVVCEKPLALTTEDADSVVVHAQEAGVRLFPAHVVRYFPQYAAAHRAADAGQLGALAVLRFERTGAMPRQPWFADPEQSGGIVMDQMIHDMDQAVWFAGPATSVYAQQNVAPGSGDLRTAHVVLEHAGGAISHCRGYWGAPGTRFRYRFSIAGDEGRLDYDSAKNTGVEWDEVASAAQQTGDGFLPDLTGMPSPYALEIAAFHAVITGQAESIDVTAADGAEAVRISRAALESLATGKKVQL
jgi:predicted dehydrogenase